MPKDAEGYKSGMELISICRSTDWIYGVQSASAGIGPSLPAYLVQYFVAEPAAVQERNKQRQSEGRNGAIEEWEVRFGNAGIETKQSPQPEQKKDPAGAKPLEGMRTEAGIPEVDREPRQA